VFLWVVGLLVALVAQPAQAASPYLYVPSKDFLEASPAHRFANMTNEEAYAELDRRGVPYRKVGPVKGVRAPVRLTGRLHGVHIHSALPEEQRATTIFEILDARLALTLDEFAAVLERHDIVEVVHYTMYRPNLPKPGSKEAAMAKAAAKKKKAAQGKAKAATKTAKTRKGSRKGRAPTQKKATGKTKSAASLGKGAKTPKRKGSSKAHPAKKKQGEPKKKGSAPKSKGKPPARAKGSAKSAPASKSSSKTKSKKTAKSGPKKSTSKTAARKSAKKGTKRGKSPRSGKKTAAKHRSYAPPGTRHPAGLAIDVGGLRKRDGRMLSVAHHFRGKIGARTCGPTAKQGTTPAARELRSIVCECADLGLFTYVLTPNYDAAHADHFHMEIRGDVHWLLYH